MRAVGVCSANSLSFVYLTSLYIIAYLTCVLYAVVLVKSLNPQSATLEELSATLRNVHAEAVGGLVRRRYRRGPGARRKLHAPSGIRKHRVSLWAAELRPASRPKLSVEKRTPPLLDLRDITANFVPGH
jgi:hypothetical protein